jgi:DNA topoisomerase-2
MSSSTATSSNSKCTVDSDEYLTNLYQKKTDLEHILCNPDTYIGAVTCRESPMWIFNEDRDQMQTVKSDAEDDASESDVQTPSTAMLHKTIYFNPGLFKLFDEGIVNCRDHVIRMLELIQAQNLEQPKSSDATNPKPNTKTLKNYPVKNINITIQDDGTIIMYNDGNGVDIVKHPVYDIWVPELLFGTLRSSTNYDMSKKKVIGGKNGYGVKLAFIWSTLGSVETVDHKRGLKYTQEYNANFSEIGTPKVTKCKTAPYTQLTFKPDYTRLGLPDGKLTPDVIALFKKRAYDISAVTDKAITVRYNSVPVPVKNFMQYVDLFIGDKKIAPRIYESVGERWEYAIAMSPTHEFMQVSLVNGIYTSKGGKHVDYILNQITKKTVEYIKQHKKVTVTTASIKEQLFLFIRCDIENPAFDSQSKDSMESIVSTFGSKCEVSDKVIEKLAKMGIMAKSCALSQIMEKKAVAKTDGTKCKNVYVDKLVDANWAGTAKSGDCTLFLVEGDSAKAGLLSGMSSTDRDKYGIYPMKGKLLNVRGQSDSRIRDNKEITDIIKALGLSSKITYNSVEDVQKFLRYGKIRYATDQDLDGSHIKGLLINLFDCGWNSLLRVPGMFGFMNTPILKATKGKTSLDFYNDGEYSAWKETPEAQIGSWSVKYYKGLGTSTAKEFKEYFKNLHLVAFNHSGDVCADTLDMAFSKTRVSDRKVWIKSSDPNSFANTSCPEITYADFVNKELVHFSNADCIRSIPSLIDGLKPGMRKVIYSCFKRNLTSDIKVAQLGGYVSEHSGYHHGEVSLAGTIIGMAQNYTMSNNVNLLVPSGQFGTRLEGGKDHASPRYIFTHTNPLTRLIFPEQDNVILKYLEDDGVFVEPNYYVPIIPMVLVNGSSGMGTGFSTDIPCFNPLELIDYLNNKLKTQYTSTSIVDTTEFKPYYEGFNGTIEKHPTNPGKYITKGKYERVSDVEIRIVELPIGTWTTPYASVLVNLRNPEIKEKELEKKNTKTGDKKVKKSTAADKKAAPKPTPKIKDFKENCTDATVCFTVQFAPGKLAELELDIDSATGVNGVEKLLKLTSDISLTNMHMFNADCQLRKYDTAREIVDEYFGTRLQLYSSRKAHIIEQTTLEIVKLSNRVRFIREITNEVINVYKKPTEEVVQLLAFAKYDVVAPGDSKTADYKYLVDMPMSKLFKENADKLNSECETKIAYLKDVRNTSPEKMWTTDLLNLREKYIIYTKQRAADALEMIDNTEDKKTKTKSTKPTKPTKQKNIN